ncbi:hypothetical protein JCM5350_000172 [Sporobolomyces pararoseus]
MSLQLPPELLRLVVDNFLLPPFSSPRRTLDLEKETRSTLYSLCLTSHTFCRIAQPLLFNFIRFDREETITQLRTDLTPSRFPSLRHVFLDDEDLELEEEVFGKFRPQLDSLGLLYDAYSANAFGDTLPQAPSILVTLPWHWWEKLSPGGPPLVNLRISISSLLLSPPSTRSDCSSALREIGSYLASSTQFSQLEAVYLPPIGSLPPGYLTHAVIESVLQLVSICRSRHVEVIYEEQSDQIEGECRISEEFMRRMTRKRIEREMELSKEE